MKHWYPAHPIILGNSHEPMHLTEGVIIKGVGGAYSVSTADGAYTCTARGVFRLRGITPLVGDRVAIEITNTTERIGTLQTVKPRTNELTRPRAANIDQVIVTMAAMQPTFNAGMLDRYLLLAEHADVPVLICVNKSDLTGDGFSLDKTVRIYRDAGYPVIPVSTVSGEGLEELHDKMQGKLSMFAGPSGVGKSSLINQLSHTAACETGALSVKIARGKHTTRHSEILPLEPSGYCMDTPGFASLDISMIPPEQIAPLFREFTPLLRNCQFSNCRHIHETGCAVRKQIGVSIHQARYESYVQLMGGLLAL